MVMRWNVPDRELDLIYNILSEKMNEPEQMDEAILGVSFPKIAIPSWDEMSQRVPKIKIMLYYIQAYCFWKYDLEAFKTNVRICSLLMDDTCFDKLSIEFEGIDRDNYKFKGTNDPKYHYLQNHVELKEYHYEAIQHVWDNFSHLDLKTFQCALRCFPLTDELLNERPDSKGDFYLTEVIYKDYIYGYFKEYIKEFNYAEIIDKWINVAKINKLKDEASWYYPSNSSPYKQKKKK